MTVCSSCRGALPAVAAVIVALVFAAIVLAVDSQMTIMLLGLAAVVVLFVVGRLGLMARIRKSMAEHETAVGVTLLLGCAVMIGWFYEDHFPLLMLATVLLYATACVGLTVQFGHTGMVNFAGASFFGIGAYVSAVVVLWSPLPHLLALPLGGLAAMVIGSILVLPMLRTKGHYTAVITIAFAILFRSFLEVNDTLGGSQGLRLRGVSWFGFHPGNPIEIGDYELSQYVAYSLAALVLAALVFILTRRLERSWMGLCMDAVRSDETAAACFGIDIRRWKVMAFSWGNFVTGAAGALYGMMLGYIAPNNFTFSDSLILVSIILLGGIGNLWGVIVASCFVILLPEKFQAIQEYRFLLYAVLVMLILLFRPQGLLPRRLRTYFPGGGH